MIVNNLTQRLISERFELLGIDVSAGIVDQLTRYVELLSKWNQKINLTSLSVDPLAPESIDRLLVEPVVAAGHAPLGQLSVVDIGSGGGSPAIPFKITLPDARIRLIESRSKKCAFLREVIRDLGLTNSNVEEGRFEDLAKLDRLHWTANLIIVRAVKLDQTFLDLSKHLLEPGGVVLRFCSNDDTAVPNSLEQIHSHALVQGSSVCVQTLKIA